MGRRAALIQAALHALCNPLHKGHGCAVIYQAGMLGLFRAGQAAGVAIIIGIGARGQHPQAHPGHQPAGQGVAKHCAIHLDPGKESPGVKGGQGQGPPNVPSARWSGDPKGIN